MNIIILLYNNNVTVTKETLTNETYKGAPI